MNFFKDLDSFIITTHGMGSHDLLFLYDGDERGRGETPLRGRELELHTGKYLEAQLQNY